MNGLRLAGLLVFAFVLTTAAPGHAAARVVTASGPGGYDDVALTGNGTLLVASGEDFPGTGLHLNFISAHGFASTVSVSRPPGVPRRDGIMRAIPLAAGRTVLVYPGQVIATYAASGRLIARLALPDGVGHANYVVGAGLQNGSAVLCYEVITSSRDRTRAYATVVSATGRFSRPLLVADTLSSGQDLLQPCQVTVAGGDAVLSWSLGSGSTYNHYQNTRQMYLSRLEPGPTLSAPVQVLPAGDDQLMTLDGGEQSLSVAPDGRVAVAWPYMVLTPTTTITRQNIDQRNVREVSEWRMRWLADDGTLGPVTALQPAQSRMCSLGASGEGVCGVTAAPTVSALPGGRALAVWVHSDALVSELVTAGGTDSPRRRAASIAHLNGFSVAGGGGKVLVVWNERGGEFGGFWAMFAAAWSDGRWGPVRLLARNHGNFFPVTPQAEVNARGQAGAAWQVGPFRPPLNTGGWAAAIGL